jgi:UDP-N-acetylglucosamine--N-acetylmuramyl-(pentapeptide) pyrophosphoryl-undecaprenol N-acetylglucosamine transferase
MKVLVTAGGTGGHIMPAVAIAEAVRSLSPETEILFVGTDRGMEERIARLNGLNFVALPSLGIKGKSTSQLARALLVNTRAFARALGIVRGFAPDWVIGTGGYVTGMVVLAGRILGCTCAIQEQNAVPGLTNRLLGRIVHRVYLSFPDTTGMFDPSRARLTGNPLRRTLVQARRDAKPGHLLVLGGSLGARSINRATVDALKILRDRGFAPEVVHQCGTDDCQWVSDEYRDAGIRARVHAFIDDMASVYAGAALAVSRCGGITLAELSALGLPSIMIPFPHASDDHQSANGRYVAERGGGWLIAERDLTPERLASEIQARLTDTRGLETASKNMRGIGLGAGARIIAEEIAGV